MSNDPKKAALTRDARTAIDRWEAAIEAQGGFRKSAADGASEAADATCKARWAAMEAILEVILSGVAPNEQGRRRLPPGAPTGIDHRGRFYAILRGDWITGHNDPFCDDGLWTILRMPLDGRDGPDSLRAA